MEKITFSGEHLLIGNIGKLSVYLAVACALFAFIAYTIYFYNKEKHWFYAARASFVVHGLSVVAVFTSLFIIIQQHYFEYQYAWQHSSLALPLKYLASCFWEGQEGSFLLWMFWHVVIGFILLRYAKSWETPVLAVLALVQLGLSSMLLGIDLFGYKIGSSPFNLLRDVTEGPIFSNPGYLGFIKDGNGLNPLLQNYWMVIHPPTLFFGFAATVVPFAYAVAGIWKGDFGGWVKPALPWAIIAVMILGTGIIMGGYWAYESLSFGGYWAWDPVENASLIPWLIMIAAVHLMLIYKSTGKSAFTTLLLTLFAFFLVLYATFLTRSGVLGNTSVHSFTDLGMSGQLLIFLALFILLPTVYSSNSVFKLFHIVLAVVSFVLLLFVFEGRTQAAGYTTYLVILFSFLISNLYKKSPHAGSEDHYSSREFWIFIGSLFFVLSCMQVIGTTSIPVFNKITGSSAAPPQNVIEHYNQWQMPFAIIIALFTAVVQYFKYKKSGMKGVYMEMLTAAAYALLLTAGGLFIFKVDYWYYVLFMFAAWYAVVGNVIFLYKNQRRKIKNWGSSVAHIGFGVLLIGVLVSSANKETISLTETVDKEGKPKKGENITLNKNRPEYMAGYEVTYLGDSVNAPNYFYKIRFRELEMPSGKAVDEFMLLPNAQISKEGQLMSNPDTRHYPTHDVFTYVTSVPDKESVKEEPFKHLVKDTVKVGDTVATGNCFIIVGSPVMEQPDDANENNVTARIILPLKLTTFIDSAELLPSLMLEHNTQDVIPDENHTFGIRAYLTMVMPDFAQPKNTKFVIALELKEPSFDYVTLKAMKFPFINLVWTGTVLMVIGFAISAVKRFGEVRSQKV